MYKVQENFSNAILRSLMDNLHHRLKVELGRKKIFYYNYKEHLKISRIAKFGAKYSKIWKI